MISVATLQRTLSQTNFSKNPYKKSEDRELHRYEFIEILVRIAQEKFCAPKVAKNVQEAVEKLIVEYILPNNEKMTGFDFRKEHFYSAKVDELLQKNESVLKEFFGKFLYPDKKYINLEEGITILY